MDPAVLIIFVIAVLIVAAIADIRQPADVVGGWAGEPRGMEIRISLDRVEPPAGRLRLVPGPEPAPGPAGGEAIPFTGWLGLLRALSEVVGPADGEHLDRG